MIHKFLFLFIVLLTTLCAEKFPKGMIMIGDSISDIGNTQDIGPIGPVTEALSPITNGPTWPAFVYYQLGLSPGLIPSAEGGLGFAQSGAITNIFNPTLDVGSILSQVSRIPPGTSTAFPVFIEGGYNDVNFTSRTGAEGAAAYIQVIQATRQRGFKSIIVLNLFDIGRAPTNAPMAAAVTNYVLEFNTSLRARIAQEKQGVLLVNFFSLANDILDNPGKYLLFNTTAPTPLTSPPAGFFFFYDGIHPNQAVYRILADYVSSMLLAPPCIGAMAEVPFSLNRQHHASLKQQLFPLQPRHQLRKFYPFIVGNYAPLMEHETFAKTKQKLDGGEVIVGITNRVADDWTLGLSGSYTCDDNDCRSRMTYDLSAVTASLFGVYEPSRGYVRAVADYSWLDFSDIKRKFSLGPVKNQTHSDTDGHLYSITIDGSYFVVKQGETIYSGPLATIEFQHIRVDGFKERGADFGNLAYDSQSNHSFVTGLGWEVDWNTKSNVIQYGVSGSIAVKRQWLKNSREIRFRERALPEGKARWPYRTQRITYASGLLNGYVEFSTHLVVSLGYFFNLGSFRFSEHVLTVGLTIPIGS